MNSVLQAHRNHMDSFHMSIVGWNGCEWDGMIVCAAQVSFLHKAYGFRIFE